MRRWLPLISVILLSIWVAFLARGAGEIPALGPMLGLNGGVWDHAPFEISSRRLLGLSAPVDVAFDKNGVPHIFATNETDLYLAQGYLMASQRLFQMDLITRITDGRLSELFGAKTIETDQFFVQFGMRESAKQTLEKFSRDPETVKLLQSFANGVNAYIDSGADLAPEYKILGARPEPFSSLRIMHMDKQLTFGLAGRSFDTYLTRIQQQLGTEKVLDLFPLFDWPELDDFVIPSSGKKLLRAERLGDFPFVSHLKGVPFFPLPAAGNGSNNWAVSAKKSTTGASIFANDTHLGQTLPNVWYEVQLHVPEFNVYGVALTAIPGIINGFNKDIAWGPTNGTLDALDYYEIEFENETSYKYKYGNQWLEPELSYETVPVKGGVERTIEVMKSRFGFVLYREGKYGLAAAWTGHNSDDELKAVRGLYAARDIDACLKSFHTWATPVQNFVCADRKDVAIQHTGFLPDRKIGEGRFIMDGSKEAIVPFAKSIAESARPRVVRPQHGFVLSANQRVTDASYPHYMGWDFEDPFRGMTIRRNLLKKSKLSPKDFIDIQNDDYELPAELALPDMLKALGEEPLEPKLHAAIGKLKTWNYHDNPEALEPALFRAWFESLSMAVFDDEYKVQTRRFRPKDARLIQLMRRVLKNPTDSDSQWVDNKDTINKVETLQDIARTSLNSAWSKMAERMGADQKNWNFKNWNRARMNHVAHFPGFGSEILAMSGSADSIRGNAGNHGAVYKLVVALGDWPKAWVQVPGGNDGDPFGRQYERFVKDWSEGQMREVEFYRDFAEAKSRATRVIQFTP